MGDRKKNTSPLQDLLVSPTNLQDFRGNPRLIRHCEILCLQNRGNPPPTPLLKESKCKLKG